MSPTTSRASRRQKAGRGFAYYLPGGELLRDPKTLKRVRSLAVPPAYTQVWICPRADGHIQATGRDAKGRKQYRYHPKWTEIRDETKYERLIEFAESLPGIRARIEKDLATRGLSREKVLATVVYLLDTTLIRVGNEKYTRDNKSFGLTTLAQQACRGGIGAAALLVQGQERQELEADGLGPPHRAHRPPVSGHPRAKSLSVLERRRQSARDHEPGRQRLYPRDRR